MIKIFKLMRPKFKVLAFITILLTMLQVVCFLLSPNLFGTIVSLIANKDKTTNIQIEIIKGINFFCSFLINI